MIKHTSEHYIQFVEKIFVLFQSLEAASGLHIVPLIYWYV